MTDARVSDYAMSERTARHSSKKAVSYFLYHISRFFQGVASLTDAVAVKLLKLEHGVLAYTFLAALTEREESLAAPTPHGIITTMSLLQSVNQQLPELIAKYEGGEKQYPVSASNGMDFPLLVR